MALTVHHEEVALCVLIHFFVHPPSTHAMLATTKVQRQLAAFLLKLIKSTDTATFPSLRMLCDSLARQLGEAGEEYASQLAIVLKGLKCPDDILRLFDSLGVLLVKNSSAFGAASNGRVGGVDPSSPLGLFLRRCRVTFHHMTFEAVAQLCSQVLAGLAAATDPLPPPNEGQGEGGRDDPGPPPEGALRDMTALDAFLNRQLSLVDQHQQTRDGTLGDGSLPPQLEELAPEMPKVMQVQLAIAMQRRDYSAAIETLHRYYDYGQAGSLPGDPAGTPASRGRRQQHALLSLSAVHTSFGHTQEALQALNETFRLAQQAGDATCSAHALATLCQLLDSCNPGAPGFPDVSIAGGRYVTQHHVQLLRLLRSCLERGQELHCPHLTAYAKVAMAKFALQHTVEPASADTGTGEAAEGASAAGGGGRDGKPQGSTSAVQPTSAIVQVRRALRDTCLLHHAATLDAACPQKGAKPGGAATLAAGHMGEVFSNTSLFGPPGVGVPATAAASVSAVHQATGAAHLVQSGAWTQFGNITLSHLHALIHLACYSSASSAEDTATAYAQLINAAKDKHGLAAAEAISQLSTTAFPPTATPRPLLAVRLLLAHDRALAHGRVVDAQQVTEDLLQLADPVNYLGMPLRVEAQRGAVLNLVATGSLSEANTLAIDLFCKCSQAGMQVEAVQSLLLLSEIHLAADNPLGALPYALSCLLHATSPAMQHDLLAAKATLIVGKTWLSLCPSHVREIELMVEEVMPLVVSHGNHALRAQALSTCADIIMCGANSQLVADRADQLSRLLSAAAEAEGAIENHGRAAETWYLLAQVHNTCAEHLRAASAQGEGGGGLVGGCMETCVRERTSAAARFQAALQQQAETAA